MSTNITSGTNMKIFIATFFLLISMPSYSADVQGSIDALCGKIKTCGTAEVASQDLPPEMKAMMMSVFDNMCESWVQPYAVAVGQAGLEDKAESCIKSIVSESCQDLMQNQGGETSECLEFTQAAEEAGVAIPQSVSDEASLF